jgi:hypothetical protein
VAYFTRMSDLGTPGELQAWHEARSQWQLVYDTAYTRSSGQRTLLISSAGTALTLASHCGGDAPVIPPSSAAPPFRPRRILEIGRHRLLLFRLALTVKPISARTFRRSPWITGKNLGPRLAVCLNAAWPTISKESPGSFDCVLNSIVVDFLSVDYLVQVLGAARRRPGGTIFVGMRARCPCWRPSMPRSCTAPARSAGRRFA